MVVTHVDLILSSGQDNFCLVHVSLIPVLGVVGEQVIRNNLSIRFVDSYLMTLFFIFSFSSFVMNITVSQCRKQSLRNIVSGN